MSTSLQESITQAIAVIGTERSSSRRTTTIRYSITATADAAQEDPHYAVAVYQRFETDVYVLAEDALIIQYRRKKRWSGKRRRRLPERSEREKSRPWFRSGNVKLWNVPLCRLSYWRLLEDSTAIIRAGYKQTVTDPFRIDVSPLNRRCPVEFPDHEEKSLYQIANKLPVRFKKSRHADHD